MAWQEQASSCFGGDCLDAKPPRLHDFVSGKYSRPSGLTGQFHDFSS